MLIFFPFIGDYLPFSKIFICFIAYKVDISLTICKIIMYNSSVIGNTL
jgi:hypothetical protein